MILPRDGIGMERLAGDPSFGRLKAVRRLRARSPESPAGRLVELGAGALACRELLTLLLDPGRGQAKAEEAALRLLTHYNHNLSDRDGFLNALGTAPIAEIARVAGIGQAAAARLVAALELGRRAALYRLPDRVRLKNPRAVYERMTLVMAGLAYEEFHVLLLNTQNELVRDVTVGRGTVDSVAVDPRAVFRPAVQEGVKSVVLVHNHPSGEPRPSPMDVAFTRQTADAGLILGIAVLDHIIVGEGRYYSFVEENRLPKAPLGRLE
jgi:DNA repair protein RadC